MFLTFTFVLVRLSATVNFTHYLGTLLKTLRKTPMCPCHMWPRLSGLNTSETGVMQAGTNECEEGQSDPNNKL